MNRHQLQPSNCRQEFADFLQRLANGADFDTEEWSSFVVAHYHDEALEEIRRMTARMGCGYMDESWTLKPAESYCELGPTDFGRQALLQDNQPLQIEPQAARDLKQCRL